MEASRSWRENANGKNFQDRYQSPPADARGWTRWWWYGCAITKKDIDTQLFEMAQASIGGVEIQVTYPLDQDRETPQRQHLSFFSPEFFEMITYLIDAAQRYDIRVDFTLGSGWPFGGAFITQDMAPVTLMPYTHDAEGPCNFSFDYTCVLPGRIARVILIRIEKGVLLQETAMDITDHLQPVRLYGWPWGAKLENVVVPEGSYRIFTFVEGRYRQTVGLPAPGMEGFVIDHCRKDVCDLYFSTLGDTFLEKLGPGTLHGFFCDSIELGGNNWASGLTDAFASSRGYDLTTYLPALWANMGDVTPRIRYDYYKTFSELTIDSFFRNFTEHCERWGVLSRIQAHGIWADILKAYGVAHIPEGETFGSHDRYDVNTIHRRLAVSAGLVYGRPIVSNESFTWLRMPRFLETPEMVKRAADAIFCDGINRIVNHGWSHSPVDIERPGWPFYASSMLSMNNTWWSYYPALGRYIHRISAFMQAGPIHSEVAVYLPQADIWSDSPMAELHMCMKLDEYLGHDLMNTLQRQGFWFTYVNDEAIETAELTETGMRIGENVYKAVLLVHANWMPIETVTKLDAFVRAGGNLLAVETYPKKNPGLIDAKAQDAAVRETMEALFNGTNRQWRKVDKGRVAIAPRADESVTRLLAQAMKPGLCSNCEEDIGYIRRDIDGKPVYFIANIASKRHLVTLSLPHMNAGFVLMDALTGEDVTPVSIHDEGDRLLITLSVEENQSFLMEISQEDASRPLCAALSSEEILATLAGWTIEIDGSIAAETLPQPIGWQSLNDTRYYCGEGIYRTAFTAPETHGRALILRFGAIHCCAEVFVNNQSAGRLWKAPFELDITAFTKPGENDLRVVAVNTWFNEFFNPDREEPTSEKAVIDSWPYFTRMIDAPRARRIYGWREREMITEVQPSGIDGCVYLCARSAKGG